LLTDCDQLRDWIAAVRGDARPLEDGVPTLGVIDLPFLGVRLDSGAVADVDALEEGIIGMGDAFHRGARAWMPTSN
jgi:hypothetical protein